jgi:hypothetical protein
MPPRCGHLSKYARMIVPFKRERRHSIETSSHHVYRIDRLGHAAASAQQPRTTPQPAQGKTARSTSRLSCGPIDTLVGRRAKIVCGPGLIPTSRRMPPASGRKALFPSSTPGVFIAHHLSGAGCNRSACVIAALFDRHAGGLHQETCQPRDTSRFSPDFLRKRFHREIHRRSASAHQRRSGG